MSKQKTTAILLAGGLGRRMGAAKPKQYLQLGSKPVARYSFELFLESPYIHSIVVVCSEDYRSAFSCSTSKPVHFAEPGLERQDSAYNGFCLADEADLVCIHDAAYPLLSQESLHAVIDAASEHGAAVLASPDSYTIKEVDARGFVTRTPDRSKLWQAQTPQVIRRKLLAEAYDLAAETGFQATDDVALMELIHQPVKIVPGDPNNIKLTTARDFKLAEQLIHQWEGEFCEG